MKISFELLDIQKINSDINNFISSANQEYRELSNFNF